MNVKNSSQNTVKKYEELTFTDDFMFCKVMQNNPDLCKHLIELIIGKKITMITYPDTQKAIEITADGKGIRMDVYVEGDEGTIYDIEMQTSMLSNLNKRVGIKYAAIRNNKTLYDKRTEISYCYNYEPVYQYG